MLQQWRMFAIRFKKKEKNRNKNKRNKIVFKGLGGDTFLLKFLFLSIFLCVSYLSFLTETLFMFISVPFNKSAPSPWSTWQELGECNAFLTPDCWQLACDLSRRPWQEERSLCSSLFIYAGCDGETSRSLHSDFVLTPDVLDEHVAAVVQNQ